MLKLTWLAEWFSRWVSRRPQKARPVEADRAAISKSLAGKVSEHLRKDMGGH